MNIEQTPLGYEITTPQVTVFFGGRQAQLTDVAAAYPNFVMKRLKQIHSDAVVETHSKSPDYEIIADAHLSRDEKLGLCIITADCIPIFFYDSKSKLIAGAHAGWRGVASRIVPKTITKMLENGAQLNSLSVIMGPHIQRKSFEAGNDVRDQILNSLGPLSPSDKLIYFEPAQDETKSFVDINQVVRTQLEQEGVNLDQLFDLHIDTCTHPDFHSYRRDKERAGRQISFISRTS